MAFYKDMKGQEWLIPPNIENIISNEHICYLVDEVVDSMDFRRRHTPYLSTEPVFLSPLL